MEDAKKRSQEIHERIKQIAEKEASESLQKELAELKSKQNTPCCCSCNDKDSMSPFIKYSLIIFVILIAILIKSSFDNSNRYYICDTDKGLEIWTGDFTPRSKTKLVFLEGLDLPETTKTFFEKLEVLPLPFNYFLDKTDAKIRAGHPYNFDEINSYIQKASEFVSTPKDEKLIAEYFKNVKTESELIKSIMIKIPSRTLDNTDDMNLSTDSGSAAQQSHKKDDFAAESPENQEKTAVTEEHEAQKEVAIVDEHQTLEETDVIEVHEAQEKADLIEELEATQEEPDLIEEHGAQEETPPAE